ncbi:ammonium transporter, Amt family [Cohaesibacter sp. ES.047]|uniref:ammonium transporter n=1 Tax=Cohaesibacter sp. ES.047 TaxID=1798205 RepID=UPI000BB80B1C|nr:ammonium transporter [Cohaesibacter sp. ES.047]SNY91747.1 ammonium transporter, Amt family [Cohaesibacter sp. ES.047]
MKKSSIFITVAGAAALFPSSVWAASDLRGLSANLDLTWIMAASALVMFMQAGFLLLEAGMVRSKNSINVAQKNLLDFVFSIAAFAIAGFMIAFGPTGSLMVGFDWDYFGLSNITSYEAGFFVFQVMFCGTAATIVSGAVAERMRLSAYIIGSIFLSSLIYPVFAHWAWGDALRPNEGAFLANMGFIDFAGSTVVHATGGWVALAACIALGPRMGRFDEAGNPVRMAGHSPVLATTGVLLLFIGWLGFNGGSTLKAGEDVAFIILNTILAGGFGTVAGHIIGYYHDGYYLPEKAMAGMLGGLVAVTAGCAVLSPGGAIMIGILGGCISIIANHILETKFKIDDAVGAIGAHAFAGVAGTIGLALLAPADQFEFGRLHQLYVQGIGSGLNFCLSFGLGFLFFSILRRVSRFRATLDEEKLGLNISEHATRIGVGHVESALEKLLSGKRNFVQRLPTVPGDEAENLTKLFNDLMVNLEKEHKQLSELELLQAKSEEAERIAALSNATFEGIAMHRDDHVVDCNQQLADLLGYTLDEVIGASIDKVMVDETEPIIQQAIAENWSHTYEAKLKAKSGEAIPVAVRGRSIDFKGEPVRIACFVDLRERKQAEQNIRLMAQHDPLTGLANRSLFNEQLETAVNKAKDNNRTALILIDLDRFKNVNDVHGHQAGDIVIKETAKRLKAIAGENGTVARLGGDEFAIIQNGLHFANQAADTGHRIVAEMSIPIPIDDNASALIGASVGIALCPEHGTTAEMLFSRADIALYHSKNTGRNMSNMFRNGLNALMEKRRALQADLENALERGEFELYYQPRACAGNLEINAYEALLRWKHPERGLVSPAEFIPVAEASGMIIDIDEWVFRQACIASTSILKGADISVNISPLQFQQKDLVNKFDTILCETGADPACLELELTEGMLIEDDARGLSVMKMLKKLGLALALDDFGTGYSSLSYLSKYPFDTIKIDRGFVANLGHETNAVAIMNAIIGLGTSLGMKIVAEGVETAEEAVFLRRNGCDQLQGYLIGRPKPVSEIIHQVADEEAEAIRAIDILMDTEGQVAGLRSILACSEEEEDSGGHGDTFAEPDASYSQHDLDADQKAS